MMGGSPPPRSIYLAPPSQRYFVGLNRAQLRGWIWLGAAGLGVLAYFAWPDLLWVVTLLAGMAVLVLLGLHAQGVFSEVRPSSLDADDEPRDIETGGRD